MSNYGQKIKQLRELKGISQKQVADEAGIKPSSYFNIEIGKTQSISIEVGKGIARALDVSFNELFEIEGSIDHFRNDRIKELEKEVARLSTSLVKEEKQNKALIDYNERLKKEILEIVLLSKFEEIYNLTNRIAVIKDEQHKEELLTRIESYKLVIIDRVNRALNDFIKSENELFRIFVHNDPNIFNLLKSSYKDGTDFIAELTKYWNQFVTVDRDTIQKFWNEYEGSSSGMSSVEIPPED